jgi:hypothetical protein
MVTAVASGPAPTPYLVRAAPRALVLGSFFVVAVPLAVYLLFMSRAEPTQGTVLALPVVQGYSVIFGLTHFFLTFTVYMSSPNIRHFLSTPRNVFAFLVAPLTALVGLAVWHGSALSERFVLANVVLFMTIRGFDFYHLSRQSFGVIQLFKGRSLKGVPAWTRTAENLYFLALAMLMYTTFLSDLRFDAHAPLTLVVATFTAILLGVVLVGYAIGLRAGANRKATMLVLGYLAVQTGSSLLAVYRTGLYAASLAVHYVEYHVIMAPRVFRAPIDEGDRALSAVRRAPIALYLTLLMFGFVWLLLRQSQDAFVGGGASGSRMLVHVFDGIFVFHYIIEMSIWKFSDPYFRKSLGPLYMG